MARHEQDREDLLAEATALVERISIRYLGNTLSAGEESVIGFRRDGSVSFFLTPQRVYQFNASSQLRRAFIEDQLYKAEQGRLVAMTRERAAEQVLLLRSELDEAATETFLARMRAQLAQLTQAIDARQFAILGQVPAEGNTIARVRAWLADHAGSIAIARAARL